MLPVPKGGDGQMALTAKGSHVPAITGAAELVAWFGHWPSFHDAEVLSLHLNREGESLLEVHTWRQGATGGDGHFTRDRECVVRFTLTAVSDLELAGFS